MRLIRRFVKELFYFPSFVLTLLVTPFILVDITSENRKLRYNHKRVVRALTRHRTLRKLLRHALSLDIRFSIHQNDMKRQGIKWWIVFRRHGPWPSHILAGRYLNFLASSFDETSMHPVIWVQIDHQGRIKPSRTIDRLYFLSHELGHLTRHQKGQGRCSWGERRDCFYDELSATLEGVKILKNLGYPLDFPAFARQALKTEFSTGRCSPCIDRTLSLCIEPLNEYFHFQAKEKTSGWTLDPSKFLDRVKDL